MRTRASRSVALAVFLLVGAACSGPEPAGGPFVLDLVLAGGRVIDPETDLDAVRDVGIAGGEIVAVSEEPLEGSLP